MVDKSIDRRRKSIFLFCFVIVLAFSFSVAGASALKKVLVLGNSITKHGPAPNIGWKGNWGMAASKEENDFVHLLKSKLKAHDGDVEIRYANISSSFERKYWNFDKEVLGKLKTDFQPDVLILRLGENIPANMLQKEPLEEGLKSLVNFMSDGRKVNVCITTTFWENPTISAIMKQVAREQRWGLADLSGIANKKGAKAVSEFANKGVGAHPSDKGMLLIANRIWKVIKRY